MRTLSLWALGCALALGALVAILAGAGWLDDYRAMTLFLAGVAAVSGVVGVIITWLEARTSARHLEALTEQQEQAASDIRRLAELTESSLEESRAQRPEPIVQFIYGKERAAASGIIVTRRRFARTIDIERIVGHERRAALATLPPEESFREDERSAPRRRGFFSPALAAAIAGFEPGPITAEERRSFERRVDDYAHKLRGWLRDYERYRKETDLVFALFLRFENRGRVPARGVRVVLRFAGLFTQAAEDRQVLGDPPRRPRFARRRFGLSALDRALTMPDYSAMLREPISVPRRRNVSSPRYRKGSLIVEFDIETLRHGLPEDADEPIWLTIEGDGVFTIPWEMHAENLSEPARGELGLEIKTELEEGSPIASLDELRASAEPGNGEED